MTVMWTTATEQLARGRFEVWGLTGDGAKDWPLTIAGYLFLIAVLWWLGAGIRERVRGLRGQLEHLLEHGKDLDENSPGGRWLLAAIALVCALVYVGIGVSEPPGPVLWTGLAGLGLWVPLGLFLRPPGKREWRRTVREVVDARDRRLLAQDGAEDRASS
ncbi:hypothetical protein [Streptomyces sp. SID11385]|uniref:hypothetical protein n=1 Tax=Streptomyces sp. SID11385 TaxID=2706031 RepID=UPI0013C75943|nr:hypothetical protein [Streptomyces sp. SID11385]NEA43666.1 hypothetical protein [Streptomyces sp. SID11385]